MSPLLSVIIPSYNHAAFIGEGIRSILDQSFQDFEILITDDASLDNSAAVIRQFSDLRVSLEVFPQNRGFSAALNVAIKRSKGKLISVLGSDDYVLPGVFEKQIEFLHDNPQVAAVFGMPKLVDEHGAPLNAGYREFTSPFSDRIPSRKDWLRHFFIKGNCLCHPGVMVRRAAHDELGVYDQRLLNLADFDMWVRLCMVHEIHVLPDEIVGRRILDANRNLSASRVDSILRGTFEGLQILNTIERCRSIWHARYSPTMCGLCESTPIVLSAHGLLNWRYRGALHTATCSAWKRCLRRVRRQMKNAGG